MLTEAGEGKLRMVLWSLQKGVQLRLHPVVLLTDPSVCAAWERQGPCTSCTSRVGAAASDAPGSEQTAESPAFSDPPETSEGRRKTLHFNSIFTFIPSKCCWLCI